MKPLEPTSMAVRVASKPFILYLLTSCAYFACIRYAASLIPASNGMVNSTMWMEEPLQMTMSASVNSGSNGLVEGEWDVGESAVADV